MSKVDFTKPIELIQTYSGGIVRYDATHFLETYHGNHIIKWLTTGKIYFDPNKSENVYKYIIVNDSGDVCEYQKHSPWMNVRNKVYDHLVLSEDCYGKWNIYPRSDGSQLYTKYEAEKIMEMDGQSSFKIVKV
jgi:uncharacterized pyridoxamine 5'-phosphate oxidase family protein